MLGVSRVVKGRRLVRRLRMAGRGRSWEPEVETITWGGEGELGGLGFLWAMEGVYTGSTMTMEGLCLRKANATASTVSAEASMPGKGSGMRALS